MNHITLHSGFVYGPGLMVQTLNEGMRRIFNRPIRALVDPTALGIDCGFSIGINHDFQTKLRETFREMGDKQFCSAVVRRRYGNKRRSDEGDFQFTSLVTLIRTLRNKLAPRFE